MKWQNNEQPSDSLRPALHHTTPPRVPHHRYQVFHLRWRGEHQLPGLGQVRISDIFTSLLYWWWWYIWSIRPLEDSGSSPYLTHCVTIVVGEDRVVQQSIMNGFTSCSEIFLETWKTLLSSKWNQVEHFKNKINQYFWLKKQNTLFWF